MVFRKTLKNVDFGFDYVMWGRFGFDYGGGGGGGGSFDYIIRGGGWVGS